MPRSVPRQECNNVPRQQCRNEPRQECRYEEVTRHRIVTIYIQPGQI